MKKYFSVFLLTAIYLFSGISYATFLPKNELINCSPYAKTKNLNYVLNKKAKVGRSTVFLLKNIGDTPIIMDHPTKTAGASAGWSSILSPGNWSALLLSKENFLLSCHTKDHFKKIDCRQALSVCELPSKAYSRGNYWLSENKPWQDLSRDLDKRSLN